MERMCEEGKHVSATILNEHLPNHTGTFLRLAMDHTYTYPWQDVDAASSLKASLPPMDVPALRPTPAIEAGSAGAGGT